MLSKCANPGCPATFLYLHQGKLFRLDTTVETLARTSAREITKASRHIEFFWLCTQCAAQLTLGYKKETGITVVPISPISKELARVAAVS